MWWLRATAAQLHRLMSPMRMCKEVVFCCHAVRQVRYVIPSLWTCLMFNTRPGHPALLGWQLPPLGYFSNCLRFASGQLSSDIRISRTLYGFFLAPCPQSSSSMRLTLLRCRCPAFAHLARNAAESGQVLQNYAAIMRIQHLEKKLVATAKPPVRVNVSPEDRIELPGSESSA